MQCTFNSKTEVRSIICDTTGRFVGVTFVDGSGELHALHTDSQLVKPATVEEFAFVSCRSTPSSVDRGHPKDANGSTGAKNAVIALAITGIDNRGVSFQAWECLPTLDERSRSVFRLMPIRVMGADHSNPAPKDGNILPFLVPWCSCTSSVNYFALAGPQEVAVVALQLTEQIHGGLSRTRPSLVPASHVHATELQLAWVSTISTGSTLACALATTIALFVAEKEQIMFYLTVDLFKSLDDGQSIPYYECSMPWNDNSMHMPGEIEISTMQGVGPNRAVVQDNHGGLYLIRLIKNQAEKSSRRATVTRLNMLWKAAFFSVMPCLEVQSQGGDDTKELYGSASQDTPILPEKSFMLGGLVVSLCGVSSSTFLVAFPHQICHIALS